jgi:Tol biopolymer transport system component
MGPGQTVAVKSQVRLEKPLILTQLPTGSPAERQGPVAGGMLRADYGGGGRLVAVLPEGTARVLTEQFHSASDPDVSFDGTRILFAGKQRAQDRWNIYEMRADGSSVRQITQDQGNCRSPNYQSTLYTIVSAEPWYQLTFVSDAAAALNEDGSSRATDLYSCKLDGSAVRRLTFNLSSDMDPWIMSDGRILLASWQRSTLLRGRLGRVALFGVNTDGADYALFADPRGRRIKHMPCATEGGLAVFVEADRVPWDGSGTLSCVRLRRPLHSYRPITDASDGLFHSPSPLPDGSVLVSRRPPDGSGSHGVYRLDPESGRAELVFDDPRFHDIQARLLAAGAEPDGRSSVVAEEDPHGKMYCLNVYLHDLAERSWLTPGTVKRLRVLEGVPMTAGEPAAYRPKGVGGSQSRLASFGIPLLAQRRVLGEIDVEKAGSFNIEVPANTPIELQILDADGLALRSCSWIWAKNQEPRGCIGCHEDGELTPENSFVDALSRGSAALCPPPDERRTVDFRRDVMPVIDAKCVACHDEAGAPPRLDGSPGPGAGPGAATPFHRAYQNLLARTETSDVEDGWDGYHYVHPGSARTSPLVWHLFGRNTARPWDGRFTERPAKLIPPGEADDLTEDEKRTFVEWIDMGALWDGIPGPDRQPAQASSLGGAP